MRLIAGKTFKKRSALTHLQTAHNIDATGWVVVADAQRIKDGSGDLWLAEAYRKFMAENPLLCDEPAAEEDRFPHSIAPLRHRVSSRIPFSHADIVQCYQTMLVP